MNKIKSRRIDFDLPENSNLWLITFTDLLTLLLGFFILCYAMNKNKTSYERISNLLFPSKTELKDPLILDNTTIKKYPDFWVASFPLTLESNFKQDETIRTIAKTFIGDKFFIHIASYADKNFDKNTVSLKTNELLSQFIDLGVKENMLSSSNSPVNYPPKYNISNNSLLPTSRFDIIISRNQL